MIEEKTPLLLAFRCCKLCLMKTVKRHYAILYMMYIVSETIQYDNKYNANK